MPVYTLYMIASFFFAKHSDSFECDLIVLTCRDAIDAAVSYKDNPTEVEDQILEELENFNLNEAEGRNEDQ